MKMLGLRRFIILTSFLSGVLSPAFSQEKVEASLSADLVSGYIWRGQNLGGVSLQPTVAVGYRGFSFEAWGSVGIEQTDTKEIDLTLRYATDRFSISITDYWTDGGPGFFHFGAHNTSHVWGAQVGYDFGPLSVDWYTNFAGNDGSKSNGCRAYSSYIALAAPFRLGGLDFKAEVGATPWDTDYYNEGSGGFAVCDVALTASKAIRLNESLQLPVFAKLSFNPATEDAFFVLGVSF